MPAGLCNQAWYCSAQCQQAHWSGQLPTADAEPADIAGAVTAHSRHLVPHSLTCAVLKHFSRIKCNPGMESVIRMCLDAMALQYLEDKPSHRAESSFTKISLNQPDPGYQINPQGLPQQSVHPRDGQQAPANQQATQVSPIQPTDVASAHTSRQQLQNMNICSSSQTCKQCCSTQAQATEFPQVVPPTSAPSCANFCGHTSHAPQAHAASMESKQAASVCPGLPAETQHLPDAPLPHMTHTELTQLQSHAADFTDKDKRDWLINLRFLRASMQQAHWQGDIWSEDALLDMVGRIASNNFGIYSTRQRLHPQQLQQPANPSKSCEPRVVPDQAASCQSQFSLSPDSTQRHSNEQLESDKTVHHNVVKQELPPCQVSPRSKKPCASQQPASPQAEVHSAAVPPEVLPWPLLADAHSHSPIPCPSEPAVGEGSIAQGSSWTADRAQQQQPFQPDSPVQCSRQVKPLSNGRSKHPAKQLPPKERPPKEDVVGREMYITASFFNHSCEPNCVKRRLHGQQSGVAVVTALRDIKASYSSNRMD